MVCIFKLSYKQHALVLAVKYHLYQNKPVQEPHSPLSTFDQLFYLLILSSLQPLNIHWETDNTNG